MVRRSIFELGGLDETTSVPSGRAARPEAASSVGPIAVHYWASLRPCLGTVIASRRRARFRQTLLLGSRPCEPASALGMHRLGEVRVLPAELPEGLLEDREEPHGALGDDCRRPASGQHEADLPDDVAGADGRDRGAVLLDPRRSLEDCEELVREVALARDSLAR